VLRVLEESERAVLPGTPLLELADVAGLELVVDVLSEDAVGITAGNRMRVTEWGGEGPLDGRVRLVQRNAFTKISALGVEEQRVDVIGDLPAAPASLGVGYRFVAQIVTWEGEVLAVPSSALFRSGDQWAVFQVEAGRVRLQEVQVGRRGVEFSEVSEGLAEGVEVVAFPSDQVADGVRVTTRGEG
jgi:HlyD family secretion protein